MPDENPPCGLYLTTDAVGSVPSGRLVYFHNHGDPGPGIYLPSSWRGNRARFEARGTLLPTPEHVKHLQRLPNEGFYRVAKRFHCCADECRLFQPEELVQLGYDGKGEAILFTPQWVDGQLAIPDRGTRIDRDRIPSMVALGVRIANTPVHDDGADERLLH